MEVNIYLYQTIRGPGKRKGTFVYIMESDIDKKTYTKTEIGQLEEMSEKKAELVILLKALKRLRKDCIVNVFTESQHLKTGIESWLDKWIQDNWKNARGKEIANIEQWQQVKEYRDKYQIKVFDERHSYTSWMKSEAEKEERKRSNAKESA